MPILRNALLTLTLAATLAAGCRAATRTPIPAATADLPLSPKPGKATAVFAGGCFWGTQSVFERVKGVLSTTVGYSGGSASTAAYDQVSTETTGHAESVKVVYDPSKITYGQLLRIFFSVAHDPTQLNRQGPDVGASYRSAIFYSSDEQRRIDGGTRDGRFSRRAANDIKSQDRQQGKRGSAQEKCARHGSLRGRIRSGR